MAKMYFYAKFLVEMFSQMLGTIDTAMLPARAAEGAT